MSRWRIRTIQRQDAPLPSARWDHWYCGRTRTVLVGEQPGRDGVTTSMMVTGLPYSLSPVEILCISGKLIEIAKAGRMCAGESLVITIEVNSGRRYTSMYGDADITTRISSIRGRSCKDNGTHWFHCRLLYHNAGAGRSKA